MSRDLVLFTVAVCVCGLLTLAFAHLPLAREPLLPGRRAAGAEARAWQRLWSPMLPALWALAALVGWAAQEPATTDELLRPLAFALAAPLALIVVRAAVRSVRALRRPRAPLPAATVGMFRPKVIVSASLRESLDDRALGAAVAHERAHARHRDPLRVWLAGLVTDLQWPSPGAIRRLRDWRRALELARDEEARDDGARGEDLAAALIAATKLGARAPGAAAVGLTTPDIDVAVRIHRLLEPLPAGVARRRRALLTLALIGLIAACAVGFRFGDDLLRALPIVTV